MARFTPEMIMDAASLEWAIAPGRIMITNATQEEFTFVILPDGAENGKAATDCQPDEVPPT